jgi:hypothetical protein
VLLLLCTALCLRFLFDRAGLLPGRVRHVFAAPAMATITHPTAALAPPFEGHTHFVPESSKLWSGAASVLVTATIAPTLAATFASTASTTLGAIFTASVVATDGTPVHRAALH